MGVVPDAPCSCFAAAPWHSQRPWHRSFDTHQIAAAKEKLRVSGNTPSFFVFHMWLNRQKPASYYQSKTPVTGAASVPDEVRNAAAKPFSLDTIKKRFLFSAQPIGAPTKAQRSGFCGEEESGEAPPAAEKASRFRGSGAIGGPEGAGNRNAATVCKGATERHEGCPLTQGVPNESGVCPDDGGV